MSLLEELHESVNRILQLPKLDPIEVADILGRRVELISETEAVAHLKLVGGPATPFAEVKLTVNKRAGWNMLQAEIVPGEDLPIREVSEPWRGKRPSTFKPPDPEDVRLMGAAIYRVPPGELRFGVQAPKYPVRSVVVTDRELLDWSAWKEP